MKVLISGWFSFELMGATAGDLMARDVVIRWLDEKNIVYDVAVASPFEGGIDWREADPEYYSHVIFICGPFGNGEPITEFLAHFNGCRLVGVNISMLDPLEIWNPFDLILERDSNKNTRPDITFLSNQDKVPIIGLVLVDPQKEYKKRAMHHQANESIMHLLEKKTGAIVRIDTRLDENRTGLRSAAEIESLISKMDIVVTTRLHGTVFAIKNGVPVVAVDPIKGGAKISKQAKNIGWPVVFTADNIQPEELSKAFDYCLTHEARHKTKQCRKTALQLLKGVQKDLLAGLANKGN